MVYVKTLGATVKYMTQLSAGAILLWTLKERDGRRQKIECGVGMQACITSTESNYSEFYYL